MPANAPSDSRRLPAPDAAGWWRVIFEQTAIGVAQIQTATGRFLHVNARFADTLGYRREELERLDFPALTHSEDLPADGDPLRRLVAGEIREFTLQQRCHHKEGRVVWLKLTVAPLWAPGETPHCHLALVEDITERKRAEEAAQAKDREIRRQQERELRESDRKLRTLMGNLPGLVYRCANTPDWPFEFVSQGSLSLTGYTPAEITGRGAVTYGELIHPEDRQRVWTTIQDAIRLETPFDLEYRIRAKDGREKWVFERGRAVPSAGAAPPSLEGFITDITERKQAEAALRESERKYRELVENANSIILRWDPQGKITFLNEFGQKFFGYRENEILGRNLVGTLVPETETTGRELRPLMELIRANPTAFEQNTNENRLRDGRRVWIAWTNKAVCDAAGHPIEVLSIGTDITERRRAEAEKAQLQAQLFQAQKIESVGRLAGGVAHDFNNMLQAILGNAALALDESPPGSVLRECLEEIQKSALRSADLTRQLLAFARRQTIQPKVLDLNNTVAGTLKMLRRLIGEDIDLVWMPGADLWPVKVDPSQIDQILANLCVNARDAIAGVGRVTIATANRPLDAAEAPNHPECVPGDYVLLSVRDTGTGMDQETRAHLFEPFFTTKEIGKGTGLGLATVFGIVKQNLGLVSVESEPGRGTTFKIHLPRAQPEAVAAKPETVPPGRRGPETVLLVEDEEQVLNLGRRILTRHGYTVLAASGPEAAMVAAAGHAGPIHLLITDVVMPGLNGKQLRERLRASHPELKCLFMSGYTANVIAHDGVIEGGVHFLQKPFSLESLSEKVREILESPLKP